MTKTCSVRYKNNGWNNCFLTQAFGGRAAFDKMVDSYQPEGALYSFAEEEAVAAELGVEIEDVNALVMAFDDEPADFFGGVYEWLASKGVVLVGIAEEMEKIGEKYRPDDEPAEPVLVTHSYGLVSAWSPGWFF